MCQKEKKTKITKIDGFKVYIDAEWTSDNNPVSVQVYIKNINGFQGRYIVINKIFENLLDHDLINLWKTENQADVLFYDLHDDTNVVHSLLAEYYLPVHPVLDTRYYFKGDVYIFYSFQDLGFAFGWNNIESQLKKELDSKSKYKIEQRRSITGSLKIGDPTTCRINTWGICDLSGLTNMSLKAFSNSLGITMENKELLDDLKGSMDVALKERTKIFLDYALSDVIVLEEIYCQFLQMVNDVLSTILGLPPKLLFKESTLPLTTGALVAKTFEKYIFYQAQKNSQHFYYNAKNSHKEKLEIENSLKEKLGQERENSLNENQKIENHHKENQEIDNTLKEIQEIDNTLKEIQEIDNTLKEKQDQERDLGPNMGFYLTSWALSLFQKDLAKRNQYVNIYNDVFNSRDIKTIFEKSFQHGEILSKWVYSSPFDSFPYSGASIETLSQYDSKTSTLLNCLVSGGRANNELPSEYMLENILDVDLQSCYGTALSSFYYPIGLPTILSYARNTSRPTLKEILKNHECEFLPGLYKITVSGKLSFEQDLLFSKVTTEESMHQTIADYNKKYEKGDEEAVHFSNDFVLSQRECLNSVITSDILEVLKKVCTNKELSEIMNLQVETALFWRKKDRCSSCTEWISRVLKDPGELVYNEKEQGISDTRSRQWYPISLNDFIGKLVVHRNTLKKQSKTAATPELKNQLKGRQNILKLFINTLYGCFASPYFSIGNVVLADNITARARVNVWMMCKSLNLRQSITDGGIYTPTAVNYMKQQSSTKKPGLKYLSDIRKLQKHRSIHVAPLDNRDWATFYDNGTILEQLKDIDEIVLKHINTFWSFYNLQLSINIEHKIENTSPFGIYTGKANYALLVYNLSSKSFTHEYYRLRGARLDQGEYMPVIYILHNKLLNKQDLFSLPNSNKTKRLLKLSQWKIIQKSSAQPDYIKLIRPGQVIESTTEFVFRDRQYPVLSIDAFKRKKRANFTSPDYEFKKGEKYSELHNRITYINEMRNQKELKNLE